MDWDALAAELDAWAAAGRTATLWWRDDDASAPTPALDRLLALADGAGVPLALAVIPMASGPALAERLAAAPQTTVLQHGIAHANRARPGERKCELSAARPADETLAALAAAGTRLAGLFGARARPVLVPPWNRLAAELVPRLPQAGVAGLSTFGPRESRAPADGLVQANTHVDPVDWRGTRGFLGEAAALGMLVEHLTGRRRGAVDPEEPSGLLSHHLAHDAAGWAFLEALLARTRAHPACRWLAAEEVFSAGRSA